jgi:motility quorum-sensing regulator / GCU-specific mRNA interferase toxin
MDLFKTAHYDLDELKSLIENPKTRVITRISETEAQILGFITHEEIVEQVLKIKKSDIYKSMTTHYDATLWQDVYKPIINDNLCYIKLQKNHAGAGVVVNFKLSDE